MPDISKGRAIVSLIIFWFFCAVVFFILRYPGNLLCLVLVWNTFLGALPLLFIRKAISFHKSGMIKTAVVFGLLWLLFFPNAVYLITDFIHISNDNLAWADIYNASKYSAAWETQYSTEIGSWLKLLILGIGFFLASFFGLESMFLFYKIVREKFKFYIAGLFVCIVSILGGFGVYIGRFLRFNSWNILNPAALLKKIAEEFDVFTVQFTLGFAVFILIMFCFYAMFVKNLPIFKEKPADISG